MFRLVNGQNLLTSDRITAIAYRLKKLVSTQYHGNESMDFVETSYIKMILTISASDYYSAFSLYFQQSNCP